MNLPSRWNPFRTLNPLDPFAGFQDLFGDIDRKLLPRDMERALEMRVDLTEDDKNYFLSVDLPGVKKEDIDVSVDGNRVSISAETRREARRDQEKELYSERYAGRSMRSFTLPTEVDAAHCIASYDGGVLSLTLPRKNGASARHISVN